MKKILSALAISLGATFSLPSCALIEVEQPQPRIFYVAGEMDTKEHRRLTEILLYLIEESAGSNDIARIDFFEGEGVVNVFSSPIQKKAIYAIIEGMVESANSDKSLVSSIYSLADLTRQNPDTPVHAVFVTDGTTDNDVIESLSSASKQLVDSNNLSIIVVGVNGKTRTHFSRSFSPIPSTVTFAGSIEELNAKFQRIGG